MNVLFLHAEVTEVRRERGVEPADRVPRRLERADAERAGAVVTMGCRGAALAHELDAEAGDR